MSPVTSHNFVISLLVVLTVALHHVDSTYYYYYYYYPQAPQQETYYTSPRICSGRFYGNVGLCPISSCYCARTYGSCCLNIYQGRDGLYYQQCVCNEGTICAPTTTYDAPTTLAPTTITTPTPTTARSTVTSTTARSTVTTPTTVTTTTRPTTVTTVTTPTTVRTTTTPTTTSTTTASTTTPPFVSLCSSGFRLLNGEAADQCDFTGIAKITMGDGEIVSCNAVYAPATVNGVKKLTFVTAQICKSLVEQISTQTGAVFEIEIGKQRYPIDPPLFTFVDGPDGAAFIDINKRYSALLSDLGCQEGACAYNPATMKDKLDFNDCKVASWGVSNADTLLSNGLYEAKVSLSPGGCADIPDLANAANTLCFKATSGANLVCSADSGAPVYCKAPSNGEWILVGVTAWQSECDSTPQLKVIPMPV